METGTWKQNWYSRTRNEMKNAIKLLDIES